MGNIGEPKRIIEFEPLEEPVPGRNVPVGPSGPAPVEVPEKTPEKVPS